jgi:uncharacterized Zn finger protein (UPF0148 family)
LKNFKKSGHVICSIHKTKEAGSFETDLFAGFV